jgi:hypothetical protein
VESRRLPTKDKAFARAGAGSQDERVGPRLNGLFPLISNASRKKLSEIYSDKPSRRCTSAMSARGVRQTGLVAHFRRILGGPLSGERRC